MSIAIALMGGLGLVVGVGLAIASKIFYVYVDPKVLAVDDALPGANCGGCGLPGCSSNAEAIVAGKAAPNSCVAAGPETAEAIAAILGVSVEAKEPDIALAGCTYGLAEADTKFAYNGMNDCRAAALLSGGMKVCTIGCLGLGTCAKVCPFDAITMGPEGLPVVHEGRCTGCGTCERACPKHIITLSSVTRRILKEYTTEDCTTPCQRACPAGINISAYIGAIAEGDHARAVQIIKERNPFPTVIGRICPRPCENECRRQYVDEPVAINFLKRYAADSIREQEEHVLPYKAPGTGRSIAVVGGGIEGLSAAYFAARLGHRTTVFEAADQLGGLLRTAIARYRLPMDVLDWDIEGIREMGVSIETGMKLGKDISVSGLLAQGMRAVLVAVGGWDSRLARTGGKGDVSPVPGCHLLIDVAKTGSEGYPQIKLHGHAIVIGSPNLDDALIQRCKALGASNITMLTRQDAPGQVEGVEVIAGQGIQRIYGQGDHLEAVELIHLKTSETQRMDADHIIFAAGRIPELVFIPSAETKEDQSPTETAGGPVKWEAFAPYKQPAYHKEVGLMSTGDVVTDFSAAIKAIASGRRAAASLHQAMYGIATDLPENVITPNIAVQNVDRVFHVPKKQRQTMPLADAGQLSGGAELELGYSAQSAQKEADRCLRCGLICYLHAPESEQDQAVATGT
jgi:NADPH-dependent glutamate synthase beta subunit-like oxidoreductase